MPVNDTFHRVLGSAYTTGVSTWMKPCEHGQYENHNNNNITFMKFVFCSESSELEGLLQICFFYIFTQNSSLLKCHKIAAPSRTCPNSRLPDFVILEAIQPKNCLGPRSSSADGIG